MPCVLPLPQHLQALRRIGRRDGPRAAPSPSAMTPPHFDTVLAMHLPPLGCVFFCLFDNKIAAMRRLIAIKQRRNNGTSGAASSEPASFPCGLKLLHQADDCVVEYVSPRARRHCSVSLTPRSIVFVHGLTGDRERTWRHEEEQLPWSQTLLPQRSRIAVSLPLDTMPTSQTSRVSIGWCRRAPFLITAQALC